MSVTGTGRRRERFYIDHQAGTKRCARCLQTKPLSDYYTQGKGRIAGSRCKVCKRREARELRDRKRGHTVNPPPRRNEAGHYRCSACNQYKPREHFTGKVKVSCYCKPCKRSYCRDLYRMRMHDPEYAQRRRERQNARNREAAARGLNERRAFVKTSIRTLRRRGFTLADISAISGVSRHGLYRWRNGGGFVTVAVAQAFQVLMLATAAYPVGPTEKVKGKPHPDRAAITAKVTPGIDAIGRRKGQRT